MALFRKKMSPIERRLAELQKEMATVNKGLKTVARESSAPVAPGLAGTRTPMFRENPPPAPEAAPAAAGPNTTGLNPADGELFQHAAQSVGAAEPAGELFPGLAAKGVFPARPAPQPVAPPEPRPGRERFAHYFMAGHFQNLRPSRQESRVVRNKAILMSLAVVALVLWLLYYLRSH